MSFLLGTFVLVINETASALVPLSGGIIRHAEYFVDPALSFANGWNQVYSTMVGLPAELTAAAVVIQFWIIDNNAIWIVSLGILIVICNLCFVRVYGELEFAFASLKIMVSSISLQALKAVCLIILAHCRYQYYGLHPCKIRSRCKLTLTI